jgi:hypothetical protein
MTSLVTSEPNAEMSTDTLEIESGNPRRGGGEKESNAAKMASEPLAPQQGAQVWMASKSGLLGSKRVLSFGLMSLFTTAIVVGMSIYVVHNNEFRTKGGKLIDNAGNEVSTAASETEVELSYTGLTDNGTTGCVTLAPFPVPPPPPAPRRAQTRTRTCRAHTRMFHSRV